MVWRELPQLLGDRPIKIYKQAAPDLDMQAVQPPDQGESTALDGHLLLCRYSRLDTVTVPEGRRCCLLLLLDGEQVDSTRWSAFVNVAAVMNGALFDRLAGDIPALFAEYRRLELAHTALVELIVANRPLSALANAVATIYGRYADIIDNSLNILAISENIAPPEANLLQDQQTRYVKPHVVQYLRTTGNLEKMQRSRLPVLVEDEPRNTYAYSVPITAGAALNLGYLCVFVTRGETLSPAQLHFLPKTAALLSMEMQKSRSSLLNKSTYFTHLLSDMLKGRSVPEATFTERFAAFSYDLKRWKNLIVLQNDSGLSTATDLHVLSQTLQAIFGNSVYMVQDNYLIFLVSRQVHREPPEAMVTEWTEYARANRLHIGISATFEHERLAAAALEQAKAALTLGDRFHSGEYLYLYDDLRLLDMVDKLSGSGGLRLLCFPPLLQLMEADSGEGELVQTLRRYMASGFSAAETCRELFIHRNTLYYRLNRIREIMGCDFTAPETAAQITLTFTILRYLGELAE